MALPAGRYGVTKNQLLKIKKLPMNTIKLIEELTEKFNLLGTAAFKNSTSVVTESSDLVESGAVYTALQGKADNSVIGTVEDGTNPTKAYAVGEHMIRGGKFCTVTSPVTTSSTWTLGSNYVEGDIAKILDKKTGSMTFADSEISSNITRVNEKSGVVCISASIYTATSKYTQNQYVRIATISGVAKPDSEVRFPVINSNGSIMIGLLTTSGDIFIYNYSDTSGGTVTFNFSYEV